MAEAGYAGYNGCDGGATERVKRSIIQLPLRFADLKILFCARDPHVLHDHDVLHILLPWI
jgi:hypothetical protein